MWFCSLVGILLSCGADTEPLRSPPSADAGASCECTLEYDAVCPTEVTDPLEAPCLRNKADLVRAAYVDWAGCFAACGQPEKAEQARCLSPVWYDLYICAANLSAHVVECMEQGGYEVQCRNEAANLHVCSFRARFDDCAIDQ